MQRIIDDKIKFITDIISKKFTIIDIHLYPDRIDYFVLLQSPSSIENNFEFVRHVLIKEGYVPFITMEKDHLIIRVFKKLPTKQRGIWINVVLLVVTLISVIIVGAGHYASYNNDTNIFKLGNILGGLVFFAIPLMIILSSHEMAHYYAARRHGLSASLPFFIPAPTIFGTLGAFISIRDPIPNRKALMDVGFAGPIAGFIAAIPIALLGNYLASITSPPLEQIYASEVVMYLNLPLIYELFNWIVPPGKVVHPMTLASWVGFVVTAINLLPIGQLDGGHIARALLGERAKYVGYIALGALFVFGIFYPGWLLFALVVLLLGIRHPPPLNDITPLDRKRKIVGIVAFMILAVSITPVPITIKELKEDFQIESLEPYTDNTIYLVENYSGLDRTIIKFRVLNKGERISKIRIFAECEDRNISARLWNGSAFVKEIESVINISSNLTYNLRIEIVNRTEAGVKNLTIYVKSATETRKLSYKIIVLNLAKEIYFYPPQPIVVKAGESFILNVNNTLNETVEVKIWFYERHCVGYINNINITGVSSSIRVEASTSEVITLKLLSVGNFHLIAQHSFKVAVIEIEVRRD